MNFKVIVIFAVCLGYVTPSITNIIDKKGEVIKAAIGLKMAGANLAMKGVEAVIEKKKMIANAIQNSPQIQESISAKKKMIVNIVKDVAEFKGKLLLKAISLGKTAALSALDIKQAIFAAKLQSNKPDSGSKPCDHNNNTPTPHIVPSTTPSHNKQPDCEMHKTIDIYEVEPSGIVVEAPVVYRLSPPTAFYGVETVQFN